MLTAWLIIMMLCVLVNIMYAGEADRRYVMAGRRADDDVGKLMADVWRVAPWGRRSWLSFLVPP